MVSSKRLSSIKEFIEYLPHCLICNKKLKINIRTPFYNPYYDKFKKYNICQLSEDNKFLINEKINFELNIESNSINVKFIDANLKYFESYNQQLIQIYKFCSTCLFDQDGTFLINSNNLKTEEISFRSENVRFYMKNHLKIDLVNIHDENVIKNRIFIGENFDKFLELKNCIILNQINNFSHLKKKISTAISFY